VPMIKEYIFITAFATFGGYLHAAVKEFLQAFEIVMIPNLLTGLAVILNLGLNIILVFGFGPIPSLGAVGLAVASLVVRYFMGIVLLIYCMSIMKFQNYTDYNYYKSLVKIGLPISFAIMVEFVTFNSVSIILGRISGIYAAAQTLLCTFANMTFMIPLALSNAIAVKVGFANGAKNIADLKRYSFVGITMSVMFMMLCAIVYFSVPEFLIKLFTNDVELIKITVPVLYILAMFEVFDGLQVSLSGIFKGLKKTSVVLLSNMIGYWFVAIPLGLILAFRFNFMLSGFWIGILVASIVLCLIMGIMLRTNLKKIEKEVLI
ncbi:MATE family efflux transporter, partial [bacterium]|nr:MATE family efflux transporter [bacterium]